MNLLMRVGMLALLAGSFLWSQSEDGIWISFDGQNVEALEKEMTTFGVDFQLEAKTLPVAIARVSKKHLPLITRIFHEKHGRCGGYRLHESLKEARGVNAKIKRVQRLAAKRAAIAYTLDNGETAQTLLSLVDEDKVVEVIESLSSFHDRFYNSVHGVNAAHWLRDHWGFLTDGRDDASVKLFSHNGFPQPSVILTIQGTEFPEEVIVLGGHLDSTLGFGQGVSPGADDDASGIASLTEVIRVISASGFRPKRTLKFMGYAGEEHGLLGSRHIAQTYNSQNVNVIGVLQLDMTNYFGSTDDIWLMTDYTDNAQTAFLGQLIDFYLKDLTRNVSSCGYACSDHASWFLEGFVASMPAETRFGEHNPFLHTSNDTISVSGGRAVHAVKFVRLAACYVAELAKGHANGSAPTTRSQVSLLTMAELMTGFGPCEGSCPRDLNSDQKVDGSDLSLLYGSWGSYRCLDFVQGEACE